MSAGADRPAVRPFSPGSTQPALPVPGAGPAGEHIERVEILVGHLLRYGVALAAVIMAAGLVLLLMRSGTAPHPSVPVPTSISEVLGGLLRLDPTALIDLGLVVLILTPVLRVAASLVAFAIERDRTYTLITLIVLIVLVAGFALGAAE
ncbi:DUF1634 domain-containing protein [Caldinitratiruptor microaerophilus]|uniref:Membrane protein n=1 Tax=Caldinitratiruptor microaerophilus TaxID=671077 RepID=A0AA35G9A9_9FIRM|nr:DUF1634 domain-containing protein [Caldinitratiruptor microaerophilus]BDG61263.1 membrane protein [Caldinitratiruptor microaerophilus]